MILSFIVIKYLKIGKAMRAVSEDLETAQLMGINVGNVISFTFAVGAALAGIGSVLFCIQYPLVTPTIGYMLGMKAFIAAVLGGIGKIQGALIGGFIIGFIEVFAVSFGLSTWIDAVAFAMLILILIFRPSGILGQKVIEKV